MKALKIERGTLLITEVSIHTYWPRALWTRVTSQAHFRRLKTLVLRYRSRKSNRSHAW